MTSEPTGLIRRRAGWLMVLMGLGLALAACGKAGDEATDATRRPGPELTEQDITDNNRGVALMGYFDYPAARSVFAALVERQPDWTDARVNLAIATLNRQEAGDDRRRR